MDRTSPGPKPATLGGASVGARVVGFAVLLAGLLLAAYASTTHAPFVFDDVSSILRNPSLDHLRTAFSPPVGGSFSGRPLANASFAVNRAISGDAVWSYRLVNLVIHFAAGLALFGLLRRTLARLPGLARGALPAAGIATLLWALHPLQTEAVTLLVQRAESLMGLLYLLVLYGFARATESPSPRLWLAASWTAGALAALTKEVAVTLPLLVLLYDRTFVAGSFRAAWAARGKYHLSLLATWPIVFWGVAAAQARAGTAGFSAGVSAWQYLLTQAQAIPMYARLAVWPSSQVFDYGFWLAPDFSAVAGRFVLLAAAVAITSWALWRHPKIGFLGAWFFIILGPSSSVVPIASQTMAEHRMYLPLAALTTGWVVLAGSLRRRILLAAGLLLALGLALLTVRRNAVYRSAEALWLDTVAKRPENPRAWANLAHAYVDAGRWADALAATDRQLQAKPAYPLDAHATRGRAALGLQRPADAVAELSAAVRETPDSFDVRNNLGVALAATGDVAGAIDQYERAFQLRPSAATHRNLANLLARQGRLRDAVEHYAAARTLAPEDAAIEAGWGLALAEAGHAADAIPHLQAALRLDPNSGPAELALGDAWRVLQKPDEARVHYLAAIRIDPRDATARLHLADLDSALERVPDAVAGYEAALQLDPKLAAAHHNLAVVLMTADRGVEALPHFEATVRLQPDSAAAHYEYAMALAQLDRRVEARTQAKLAVKLNPDLAVARELLDALGH